MKLGLFDKSPTGKPLQPAQSALGSEGKRLAVNPRRCPQNHPCPAVRVCPANALKQQGYGLPTVDMAACVVCGKCVRYCPMGAISIN